MGVADARRQLLFRYHHQMAGATFFDRLTSGSSYYRTAQQYYQKYIFYVRDHRDTIPRVCSFASMNTLLYNVTDGIAYITLNRPDKLNALNAELLNELEELIRQVAADSTIGAVIITGSGQKAFAAGADIAELHSQTAETGGQFSQRGQRVFDMIEALQVPVIAAVNGFALGGGCELAMACHIRFASSNAMLGLPEISLGVIPGYGGTQRLGRLVGPARALELILSCEMVNASTALQLGLVQRVTEPEALLREAVTFAQMVASKAPLAVRAALMAVLASRGLPVADGQALEAELFGELCGTNDFIEGTGAFLNKRKPSFTGT